MLQVVAMMRKHAIQIGGTQLSHAVLLELSRETHRSGRLQALHGTLAHLLPPGFLRRLLVRLLPHLPQAPVVCYLLLLHLHPLCCQHCWQEAPQLQLQACLHLHSFPPCTSADSPM